MGTDYTNSTAHTRLEALERPISPPATAKPPLKPEAAAPSNAKDLDARLKNYKSGDVPRYQAKETQ